jgi:tetratricopeptide (TPR) repeat protein
MSEPIDLFISYASRDRDRVLPIVERLEAAGVTVWIDRDGISGGASYALEIAEAIEQAKAVVLMCSEASLSSRNVKQEIALGWRFEKPYLPLLLETVEIPKDVAYWLEAAQWVEVLDRPEMEWLNDVAQALVRYGLTLQLSEASLSATSVRARPLLVGREREQARLSEHLDRMLAGQGSVILVGGDAGIGKTTLVEDLSVQAEEAGALVLWGHAYDLSVTPPYGPWLEIFRRYQVLDAGLPPLPSSIFNGEELTGVGSQDTLFTNTAEFFHDVAANRPLLLVLDDSHWFDQASLDFFRFLARQVGNQQIMLVTTYRSDELHRRHPLYTLLPLLVREAGAERVDVRPLTEAGHRALVESRYRLTEQHQARLERYLEDHAEGNPLYAGELLRTLEEAGALVVAGDGWQLGDLEQVRVPPLLRQVIEGRLARLPEATRGLLDVAAIIGQDVAFDLWATVAGANEGTLLDSAEAAVQAAVLLVRADGSGVQFRHALLREALYENVLPLRRRVWHRQTAEALAATHAPDPDQVAYHYQQAGDERAVEWLIRAGERARRAYIWSVAAERFDAALARMTEQEAPAQDQWAVLTRLALVVRYADPRRAVALLEEAAKLAREAEVPGMVAFTTFLAGLNRCNMGDTRTGLPMMMQASKAFDALSAEDLAATHRSDVAGRNWRESSLVGSIVLSLTEVGRLQEAGAWAEVLRSRPAPTLLPGQQGSSYADGVSGQSMLLALLGRVDEARRASEEAREAYAVIEHHSRLAQVLDFQIQLIQLPYRTEELRERKQLADEAVRVAREALGGGGTGHPLYHVLPLLWIEGEWETVREVVHVSGSLQQLRLLQRIEPYRGWLGYAQDDVAMAYRAIATVLPDGPLTEPGEVQIVEALALQHLAAVLALDAHDLPNARAWLEAHDRWLAWSGAVLGRAEGALGWAQYHHAEGDAVLARQQAEQALAHASDPRQPLALIAAHRFLGQLDTEAAQFVAAEEHLGESLRLVDACAAPFERALTLLEIVRLRMAQGQTNEARVLLAEVRAICEPLGAKPTLVRVSALAQELADRAGSNA